MGMDRIVVRTNADMQRVIDWSEKLTGTAVALPFPEAEISFEEEGLLLRFWDEGFPYIRFELEMNGRVVVKWRSNLETGEIPELSAAGEGSRKVEICTLLAMDNTVAKCVGKFRALMLFASYYREEVMASRVVSRVAKPRKSGSPRKGGKRMLTVRRYMIGSEMLSELPAPKREWHGYRESFGVRGHYRHMKSGKVVWVRPFVKKGLADKKADREYIL